MLTNQQIVLKGGGDYSKTTSPYWERIENEAQREDKDDDARAVPAQRNSIYRRKCNK